MTRRDDLIALRDAVQAGGEFKWEFAARAVSIHPDNRHVKFMQAKNGSVDAALAFLAAVLPAWVMRGLYQVEVRQRGIVTGAEWECMLSLITKDAFSASQAKAETPARALLLATLNALIAEADT